MSTLTQSVRLSILGCISLALAMGVGRFAYTPLLPMMHAEELITVSDGGIIASIHFIGYWIGAYVVAKLPFSQIWVLRISLLTVAIATLAMGFVENFGAWLVLRWIAGVCSAFILVHISDFITRRLTECGSNGTHGVVFSGVGLGIMLVGLACLWFMVNETESMHSWQVIGIVSIVVAISLWLLFNLDAPGYETSGKPIGNERHPLVWPMIISYGTAGLGYVIPSVYLPLMAKEIVSSPTIFGWGWPVFGVAAFLSTLLAARLRRHFADCSIWAVCQFIMATGVLFPVIFPNMAGIVCSGLLVGGTFMIITMTGVQECHRVTSSADVIRHISIMTTAFATGQMIGPVLASSIYTFTGSFTPVLIGTAVALVVTAYVLVRTNSNG